MNAVKCYELLFQLSKFWEKVTPLLSLNLANNGL